MSELKLTFSTWLALIMSFLLSLACFISSVGEINKPILIVVIATIAIFFSSFILLKLMFYVVFEIPTEKRSDKK